LPEEPDFLVGKGKKLSNNFFMKLKSKKFGLLLTGEEKMKREISISLACFLLIAMRCER